MMESAAAKARTEGSHPTSQTQPISKSKLSDHVLRASQLDLIPMILFLGKMSVLQFLNL